MYCGIDVGSLSAQAVLIDGDRLLGFRSMRVKPSPLDSARAVTAELFESCSVSPTEVRHTVATGYGRQQLEEHGLAQKNLSEISCHGAGAQWLVPAVRTIIDIGGQDAKAIRVDARGEIDDFVMNDKCASGTGRFLEVMSRTLGVELGELGTLALGARSPVELTARCSIFCETEVLHALQRGTDPRDLAGGITRAIGERVSALARRLGVEPEVTMSGGVAKNTGVRVELERLLGLRLVPCPVDPQIVGALGAAVLAQRGQR
jgi:predicted CoA-substrate-specific enzyme activase